MPPPNVAANAAAPITTNPTLPDRFIDRSARRGPEGNASADWIRSHGKFG
jgi:hypothetical protein